MNPFPVAPKSRFEGWNSYVADGYQLAAPFRDERGQYRYGLVKLAAQSGNEIAGEVLTKEPGSALRFAVIDGAARGWDPTRTGAFRYDFDFYVFTGMSAEAEACLRAHLSKFDPVSVLCFSTSIHTF